jgi:hypothetical protein
MGAEVINPEGGAIVVLVAGLASIAVVGLIARRHGRHARGWMLGYVLLGPLVGVVLLVLAVRRRSVAAGT